MKAEVRAENSSIFLHLKGKFKAMNKATGMNHNSTF